jgi:hypothetical protein
MVNNTHFIEPSWGTYPYVCLVIEDGDIGKTNKDINAKVL